MLKQSLDLLHALRNSYDEVKAEAVSLAQVWGLVMNVLEEEFQQFHAKLTRKQLTSD